MRYLLVAAIMIACPAMLRSQVYQNDAGSKAKHFLYEVKQINEFFERFNNDTASYIREIYRDKGVKFRVQRPALIRSLFNTETRQWNKSTVDSFVTNALQVEMPNKRRFYGGNWYAEASSLFEYNGETIVIPIILAIDTDDRNRSKWLIVGVKADMLAAESNNVKGVKIASPEKFISPAGHSNYFIEFSRVFDDKASLAAYFDPLFFNTRHGAAFYNAVQSGHARFISVKELKFHFLQVRNYIFTVEQFKRETLNSGWLINTLRTASISEKESFRKTLLGR
ncbi:MAG: hypothetical protein H7Y27_01895 [Gemmatimonadaceae bacterium]|nr:hypothetical protein [Chitinophagaceae bacterium]